MMKSSIPRYILVGIIMAVVLAACSTSPNSFPTRQPATQPIISPTSQPSTTPTQVQPTITPTPEPIKTTQYTIQVKFNYSLHHLDGTETIEFTNLSGESLKVIALAVDANIYEGAFSLTSLKLPDGSPAKDYSIVSNRLEIPLSTPIPINQRVRIELTFSLTIPEIPPPSSDRKPQVFGYTVHQTNLVDWYPRLPPYQPGSGWVIHKPWWYGETQVYETANFAIDFETISAPSNIILAASSLPKIENGHYQFQAENFRNFVISASQEYIVDQQTLGDFTVTSYSIPPAGRAGKAALTETIKAIDIYNQKFGYYIHKSLSIVEADFLDGMEFDGLYFLSKGFYNLYDGTPKGYLTAIAVHETAHQWWYAMVGNDQALEPWLDEALSTYCEIIFYQNAYPDLVSWWWSARVDYFGPTGVINKTVYDQGNFERYRDAVYLNGAHFLADLRKRIGDDAFFASLQDFRQTYLDRIATSADFFKIISKHTAENYSDIISKYFE